MSPSNPWTIGNVQSLASITRGTRPPGPGSAPVARRARRRTSSSRVPLLSGCCGRRRRVWLWVKPGPLIRARLISMFNQGTAIYTYTIIYSYIEYMYIIVYNIYIYIFFFQVSKHLGFQRTVCKACRNPSLTVATGSSSMISFEVFQKS